MSDILKAEEYYTIEDLAQLTGIAEATLQRWRSSNKGPSFYRIGKNIKYHKQDVLVWMESQRREQGVNRKKVRPMGLQIQGQSRGVSRFNGVTGYKRKSGGS